MTIAEPEIILVPFVQSDDVWTVKDDILIRVYDKLIEDKILHVIFCDGTIRSSEEMSVFFKNPGNYPVFILADGKLSGFAWLTSPKGNYAFGHFCFFREAWGKNTLPLGKEILKYWFNFNMNGNHVFDIILGLVPTANSRALKYIRNLGGKAVGKIPHVVHDAYRGKKTSAMLFYFESNHLQKD